MGRLFLHVNDPTVLARSSVVKWRRRRAQRAPVRPRALRRDRLRASNPVARGGRHALHLPEFFRIVRERLTDDGVFCQWVQLYQLPVSVVAGIVRQPARRVPARGDLVSSPGDVMVLARRARWRTTPRGSGGWSAARRAQRARPGVLGVKSPPTTSGTCSSGQPASPSCSSTPASPSR